MGNTFLAIILSLTCGLVLADARIEIDNNGTDTVHVPFNPNNTNDELKLPGVAAVATEIPSTGEYFGSVKSTVNNAYWYTIPGLSPITPVELNNINTGENMNMVIDDTQFTCVTWYSSLRTSVVSPETIVYSLDGEDCTKNQN